MCTQALKKWMEIKKSIKMKLLFLIMTSFGSLQWENDLKGNIFLEAKCLNIELEFQY